MPKRSASTAKSIDCSSTSLAERAWDEDEGVQWPKDRNPIFFMAMARKGGRRQPRASRVPMCRSLELANAWRQAGPGKAMAETPKALPSSGRAFGVQGLGVPL